MRWLMICGVIWVVGCQDPVELESASAVPGPVESTQSARADPVGSASLLPQDLSADGSRQLRRMNLDQLDRALRSVTGGLGWTTVVGELEIDELDRLSPTLGKPDYVERTFEDLSVSPLFSKFLSDAARFVCRDLVERELTDPDAQRILLPAHLAASSEQLGPDETPERRIAALIRHFHTRVVAPDDARVVRWKALYDVAVAQSDEVGAWRLMCVGLISHHDFYLY